jgi:hypothetical protein
LHPYPTNRNLLILEAGQNAVSDTISADVYFTPGYGRSTAIVEGGKWKCARWGDWISLPYIERCIDGGMMDVVSPYGYSGLHVAPGCPKEEVQKFWTRLREHWRDNGVMSAFLRFSPLDPHSLYMARSLESVSLTRRGDTVLIPLQGGHLAVWTAMEGRARTAVRKAKKAGYSSMIRAVVSRDLSPDSSFRVLYESTMLRVGSDPKYLFADSYYAALRGGLGSNLMIAEVCDQDGVVVACSLVMVHADRVHYHLAGSCSRGAQMGANNLLVWTIIEWAAENEKSVVHLGGGVTPDDNLFAFKKSFGGQRAEFWTGAVVLDECRYQALVEKHALQHQIPQDQLRRSEHFPLYRMTA